MSARAVFVKSARKDYPGIEVKRGESYYWWKFRHGGKHFSKTPPRGSQLQNSPFISTLMALEERAQDLKADAYAEVSDLETDVEDIKGELEALRDETQEHLDNMPEGLQQGATGELLTTRVDALESLISDLENLDYDDMDKDDYLADAEAELVQNDGENEEAFQLRVDAKAEELRVAATQERLQELLDEVTGMDWSAGG